jgi:rod shape-determining protein MreC
VAPTAEYVSRRTRRVHAGKRGGGATFPRRKPHLVVRRAVFAGLIFLSMVLLTVSYRGGAVLHGSQLAVLDVVAPIERGLSRSWDPIANAWDWSGRLFSATSDVPKLRAENAKLRDELNLNAVKADDFEKMRRDLAFKDMGAYPDSFHWIGADVIVRAPGALERSITVDVGTDDGVSKDDTVLVAGGLLGRVLEVRSHVAVVGLLLNDTVEVSAKVVGSKATGIIKVVSTEGEPTLQLRSVRQSALLEVGDLVTTSGFASKTGELHSLYPGGIPIGTISSFGNNPGDLDKTVQVKPVADFDQIDHVYILRGTGGRFA